MSNITEKSIKMILFKKIGLYFFRVSFADKYIYLFIRKFISGKMGNNEDTQLSHLFMIGLFPVNEFISNL